MYKLLLILGMMLLTQTGAATASVFLVPKDAAYLYGDVTDALVGQVIKSLEAAPYPVLVINSRGGDYDAGMRLMQAMDNLAKRGSPVTCVSQGIISSMAYYTLLKCPYRYVTDTTQINFHFICFTSERAISPQELREIADDMDKDQLIWDRLGAKVLGLPLKDYIKLRKKNLAHSAKALAAISPAHWLNIVDEVHFMGMPASTEGELP